MSSVSLSKTTNRSFIYLLTLGACLVCLLGVVIGRQYLNPGEAGPTWALMALFLIVWGWLLWFPPQNEKLGYGGLAIAAFVSGLDLWYIVAVRLFAARGLITPIAVAATIGTLLFCGRLKLSPPPATLRTLSNVLILVFAVVFSLVLWNLVALPILVNKLLQAGLSLAGWALFGYLAALAKGDIERGPAEATVTSAGRLFIISLNLFVVLFLLTETVVP